MTEPAATTTSPRADAGAVGGPRLVVPDVLRGVAILAMLIAHAAPFVRDLPGWVIFVQGNINDLASPLFALVMGMSAQLVLQRTARSGRTVMLIQQFVRALLLIGLGVWMAMWGSWVAVVLSYLGVLAIFGTPLLFLRTRWLAVVTVAVAVVSAPLNDWARGAFTWVYFDPTGAAREVASWFVLGGHYRLTNLLPFFLLGALLLRHGLRRDKTVWIMLGIAPVAYAVRPVLERVTGASFASGSYPDTLHDVGLVFATYGVVVLLATTDAAPWRGIIGAVFTPLRAIGHVALSLYVVHVWLIALILQMGWFTFGANAWWAWAVIVPGMVLLGWAWWRFVGTGPVEWVMGWVTGRRRA